MSSVFKHTILLSLVVFVVTFFYWFVFADGMLYATESNSFFATTPDFLKLRLFKPSGITLLVSSYISQFYRWQFCGALINALMASVLFLTCGHMCSRIKTGYSSFFVNITVVISFLIIQHTIPTYSIHVEYIVFWLLLVGFLSLQTYIRKYFVLFFPFIAYAFISGMPLCLLFGTILVFDLCFFKNKLYYYSFVALVLSVIVPIIWKNLVAFIPISDMYSFLPSEDVHNNMFYACYLMPLVCVVVFSYIRIKSSLVNYSLAFIGLLSLYYFLFTDADYSKQRCFCKADKLMDENNWDGLLNLITPDVASLNNEFLPYVALALNEQNQLSSKMFAYPFKSYKNFYFERDLNAGHFHAKLYHDAGSINEGLHHAFQDAVKSECGMNFRSIRSLIEWNIENGNNKLANKYISILSHSSFYKSFIKKMKAEMAKIKDEENNTMPFFIGSRPLLNDLARILDRVGCNNVFSLNLTLCGLLANGDAESFYKLWNILNVNLGANLPTHYAEAFALIYSMKGGESNKNFKISPEIISRFNGFDKMAKMRTDKTILKQEYGNTFWYRVYENEIKK